MTAQLTRDEALTQAIAAPYRQLRNPLMQRVACTAYQDAYRQFVAAHGVVAEDGLDGVIDYEADLDGWVVCAFTETFDSPDPFLASELFIGKFTAVYETRQQADDARVLMLAAGVNPELLVPVMGGSKGYLPITALCVLRNCTTIPAMPA